MTTLFDAITHGGDLKPSSTKARRSWHWAPSRDPAEPHDGTLTIRQQGGKGVNCRAEIDNYLVEVLPDQPGYIGRFYDLTNVTDPAVQEVYRVFVGVREGEGSCNCPCGKYRKFTCKHEAALFALAASGAFDGSKPAPTSGAGSEGA